MPGGGEVVTDSRPDLPAPKFSAWADDDEAILTHGDDVETPERNFSVRADAPPDECRYCGSLFDLGADGYCSPMCRVTGSAQPPPPADTSPLPRWFHENDSHDDAWGRRPVSN